MNLRKRVKKLLVAANNHFAAHAPAAAVQLKAATLGKKIEVPPRLLSSHPEIAE